MREATCIGFMSLRYGRVVSSRPFVLRFFLQVYGDRRDLHSFPTRRSSDLAWSSWTRGTASRSCRSSSTRRPSWTTPRSEEHTPELQSPDHLVCRLLLEKKKKISHVEKPGHGEGLSGLLSRCLVTVCDAYYL